MIWLFGAFQLVLLLMMGFLRKYFQRSVCRREEALRESWRKGFAELDERLCRIEGQSQKLTGGPQKVDSDFTSKARITCNEEAPIPSSKLETSCGGTTQEEEELQRVVKSLSSLATIPTISALNHTRNRFQVESELNLSCILKDQLS